MQQMKYFFKYHEQQWQNRRDSKCNVTFTLSFNIGKNLKLA